MSAELFATILSIFGSIIVAAIGALITPVTSIYHGYTDDFTLDGVVIYGSTKTYHSIVPSTQIGHQLGAFLCQILTLFYTMLSYGVYVNDGLINNIILLLIVGPCMIINIYTMVQTILDTIKHNKPVRYSA